MKNIANKKAAFAWAFYDWANSAFATTIMAGFFPVFYKQFWASGLDPASSTFQLGVSNAVASMVIVICAPIMGAIADCGQYKKQMLVGFAVTGILASAALYWIGQGEWAAASAMFCVGSIGFMGANVFYDALLLNVSNEQDRDLVSAIGYAMGYLGGGLLFSLNVAMTLSPESFGLEDASQAIQMSFLSVAIWWAVFSIPLMIAVKDQRSTVGAGIGQSIVKGWRQLLTTFKHVRSLSTVWLFLLAYWLYIDGVDTVIRMAVDFGLSIGIGQQHLITALLVTQFIGFPAAIGFGYIGQAMGSRRGILLGLGVYMFVVIWGYFMDSVWEFYLLAGTVGLVQGGVQSLSRAYYADIIPADKSAEFFGFYNMMGKSAALIGPLLVGIVVMSSGNHRLGMLSLLILFISGGYLLHKARV